MALSRQVYVKQIGQVLARSLLAYLKKPASIIFICKILLVLIVESDQFESYGRSFYVLMFLLPLCLHLTFTMLFSKKIRQIRSKWNQGKISKLKTGKKWSEINLNEIRVGDLLCVSEESVCPADLLVLDTADASIKGKFITISESKINGCKYLKKKTPMREIQELRKTTIEEGWNFLTGTLTYRQPSAHYNEIMGHVKLKSDPKEIPILLKNVIFAGTKIEGPK